MLFAVQGRNLSLEPIPDNGEKNLQLTAHNKKLQSTKLASNNNLIISAVVLFCFLRRIETSAKNHCPSVLWIVADYPNRGRTMQTVRRTIRSILDLPWALNHNSHLWLLLLTTKVRIIQKCEENLKKKNFEFLHHLPMSLHSFVQKIPIFSLLIKNICL